ncbi:MAG TPA: hypothetical protein VGG45_16475 [Terracidiphilus sp.]|jgi:hypothetical protein
MGGFRNRFSYLGILWREGVWGRWIGGAYFLLALYVFIRDDFWLPTDTSKWWIISMIPHLSLSWWLFGAALILCFWIFEASFRLYAKAKSEIANRSPENALRLTFDVADSRCLRAAETRYSDEPSGEFYSILVQNRSGKSISNISIRGLPSWFTSTILAMAATGRSTRRQATVVLRDIAELDPDATDVVELFGLSYSPESRNSEHILNNVQTFTLEGRARHTKTVSLTLEYDPKSRPMLRVAS